MSIIPVYSRGITKDEKKRAQQNTIDAISYVLDYNSVETRSAGSGSVGASSDFEKKSNQKDKWVEINTIVTDNQDIVVVHDFNLKELTGRDLDIKKLTRPQIDDLKILKNFDGIEYDKQRNIAFLDDLINIFLIPQEGINDEQTRLNFWISAKSKFFDQFRTARILMRYLQDKTRFVFERFGIDISSRFILSSTSPFLTYKMIKYNEPITVSRDTLFSEEKNIKHILSEAEIPEINLTWAPSGTKLIRKVLTPKPSINTIKFKFNISFDYFVIHGCCSCLNRIVRKFFLNKMFLEKKYKLNIVLIERENITQDIISRYKNNNIQVGIYSVGDVVEWSGVDYNMISM